VENTKHTLVDRSEFEIGCHLRTKHKQMNAALARTILEAFSDKSKRRFSFPSVFAFAKVEVFRVQRSKAAVAKENFLTRRICRMHIVKEGELLIVNETDGQTRILCLKRPD
jgi:hypothetical protein